MNHALSPAPHPAYRLTPSRFPPVGLFDTVATAADLAAVMDLVGWTNDRLVADRIARLPRAEWVYGRPNASIVMAAFLHAAPGGMRFNGSALGAWYAATDIATAAAEVGHHLRRETVATGIVYNSIRRRGGVNIVAYRPTNILEVAQADHWEIRVAAGARRIEVRRLATPT